jgi:hypothetical protein
MENAVTRPEPVCAVEPRFAQRLSPARSFQDASASIEAALAQLQRAEDSLERQLADLRSYMRQDTASRAHS